MLYSIYSIITLTGLVSAKTVNPFSLPKVDLIIDNVSSLREKRNQSHTVTPSSMSNAVSSKPTNMVDQHISGTTDLCIEESVTNFSSTPNAVSSKPTDMVDQHISGTTDLCIDENKAGIESPIFFKPKHILDLVDNTLDLPGEAINYFNSLRDLMRPRLLTVYHEAYADYILKNFYMAHAEALCSPMQFSPITSYINPINLMAIFWNEDRQYVTVTDFQSVFNNATFNSVKSMYNLVDNYESSLNEITCWSRKLVTTKEELLHTYDWVLRDANTNLKPFTQTLITNFVEINALESQEELLSQIFPQFEDSFQLFEVISLNIDNSMYAYLSLPPSKLYYPEPFVASPSFVHEEFWFMHILHFQHWLWFFFISLIMLYFIVFINVVRWCNPRVKPKRETRGVSRSKCADLITAWVPVSWAISIIISESVDTTDYFDGYGTGEVVIGIRGYQWGWEYLYPRNLPKNYKANTSYTSLVGNSLKYSTLVENSAESTALYENSKSELNVARPLTPVHAILSPSDDAKVLSFINFNHLGISNLKETTAFRSSQSTLKANPTQLFSTTADYSVSYGKLAALYLVDNASNDSFSYGISRQHNYSSKASIHHPNSIHLDANSVTTAINLVSNITPKALLNYSDYQIESSVDGIGNNVELAKTPILWEPRFVLWGKLRWIDLEANSLWTSPTLRNVDALKLNINFSCVSGKTVNDLLLSDSVNFKTNHKVTSLMAKNNWNISYDKNLYDQLNYNTTPLISGKELKNRSDIQSIPQSTLWEYSSLFNRVDTALTFLKMKTNLTIEPITEYKDYDFKEWQLLDWAEDFLWEPSYSVYSQEDYVNSLWNMDQVSSKNYREFSQLVLQGAPIFTENFFSSAALTPLAKFTSFVNEIKLTDNLNNYLDGKILNYTYISNYLNTASSYTMNLIPMPYTQLLNVFQENSNNELISSGAQPDNEMQIWINYLNNLNNVDIRTSYPLRLRSSAKCSATMFKAVQKIYKNHFAEGRSNIRSYSLSNSAVTHPMLTGKEVKYELLLGKNKTNYLNIFLYNQQLTNNATPLACLTKMAGIYFSNIPFLLSTRAEATKYLWFDHQARWVAVEVQPSSIARYSLLGNPYCIRNFTFTKDISENFLESETYINRLVRARKNYMSNWALNPFLYSRMAIWYDNRDKTDQLVNPNSIANLRLNLWYGGDYWEELYNVCKLLKFSSTPAFNDISTPNRSSYKPTGGIAAFQYNSATLSKLLTKREYLYREYYLNKGYALSLPEYLRATPTNSLFTEVQKSYNFIDPLSFAAEVSRDHYYNYLTTTKLLQIVRTKQPLDYLFYKLSSKLNTPNTNTSLYANQFRPMKKGITNMIRLHATGAIAMPTEIRLHILASSRDIIHSWSIPSAGIKIDCIPGYSSHRVAIFLTTGVFWGQCMEICGRFHHWMPIVVYFMKRDLFFLWTMNFITRNALITKKLPTTVNSAVISRPIY